MTLSGLVAEGRKKVFFIGYANIAAARCSAFAVVLFRDDWLNIQ